MGCQAWKTCLCCMQGKYPTCTLWLSFTDFNYLIPGAIMTISYNFKNDTFAYIFKNVATKMIRCNNQFYLSGISYFDHFKYQDCNS